LKNRFSRFEVDPKYKILQDALLLGKSKIMARRKIKNLESVCDFIEQADTETIAAILNAILDIGENLVALNHETNILCDVDSISLNGTCIQLNLMSKNEKIELFG
jgi:hypothetical protein